MRRPTIVVTGASGLVGPYLIGSASRLGHVIGMARHGADVSVDLTNGSATRALLHELTPDYLIHAAALTDVDLCEDDPARAQLINCEATRNIAEALPPTARLIYLSTDQVYPDTPGPHGEPDIEPANAYGRSKLAGENIVRQHSGGLVLRANFFGPSKTAGRSSLSDFFVQRLMNEEPVTGFTDVLFSPLHMQTLADVVARLMEGGVAGTYNLGCRSGLSKAEFGSRIGRHLGLPLDGLRLGQSTDVEFRAPRPKDLRMDVSRIEAVLGEDMPTFDEEIEKL